jgi:hypothetical protein
MIAPRSNIIPLLRARTSGDAEPRRTVRSFRAAGGFHGSYVILYRQGVTNYCPGCGKSHWIIGNHTAQCAFCDTALDLQRIG